jgi:hypothetical protein
LQKKWDPEDLAAALDCLAEIRAKGEWDLHIVQQCVGQMEAAAVLVATMELELSVGVPARHNPPSLFPNALHGLQTIHEFVDRPFDNIL